MSATPKIILFPGLLMLGVVAVAYIGIWIVKVADKKPRPMESETCPFVFWLSAIGIPVFLFGMALAVFGQPYLGLALIGGGLFALIASTSLNAAVAKRKRTAWPVVVARCTERQLRRETFCKGEGSNTEGWLWHLVCEIDYTGKQLAVSPKVHWSDSAQQESPFWSEEEAHQFLSQRISPNGECKVRVKPANPFEAELL